MNQIYYSNQPFQPSTATGLSACIPFGNGCNAYSATVYANFIQVDPSGGRHALGLQYCAPGQTNACGALGVAGNSLQGGDDRYKATLDPNTLNVSVVDLHGNSPSNLQGYSVLLHEDVNGNAANTTGRTPSLILPRPDNVTQTEQLTFTQSFNVNPITPNPGCQITVNGQPDNVIAPISGSPTNPMFTAVTSLTLPNTQQYQFQYDPIYKLLSKITYPTGATVTYTWSTIPNAEGAQYSFPGNPGTGGTGGGGTCAIQHDWFAITKRVVSFDGVNNALEQDFSYTTVWPQPLTYKWVSKSTTVTTKDLVRGTQFTTVYNYSPALPPPSTANSWVDLGYMPVENTIKYNDTSGSLLKTVTKVWNSINQLSAECETLPNTQISGKFYRYLGYNPTNWYSLNPAGYSTNLPTDVAEYDYGSVTSSCVKPSGLPIRETKTTYQALGTTPLLHGFPSLLDRPATVQIYGIVNNVQTLMQETDYSYDGTSPVNVSPTPIGHDETNYGFNSATPRGNPTTVTRKCFVGGTACTNSVTTYTYDTTGQVLTVTDPCGNGTCSDMTGTNHTTTYSYTDSYTADDGTPSGNTNAYVTKITEPTIGGVAHITQFKYGFEDGKLRSKTDENNQITTFCYWMNGCSGMSFDPFVRLTGVEYADSGSTTYAYSDAGPSPSVTTTKAITSSLNSVSTSSYDAMGHMVETTLSSDPDNPTSTVTTYDGMGNPLQVTNPYRSTSDSTYGVISYVYDALGRTCLMAPADVSPPAINAICPTASQVGSVSTIYSSNQTNVTDEVGNQRTSKSDSLGRLTDVWEAPTGYNYHTTYAYDALGNLLSVNQAGSRTRTFTYDSLSRLLTALNPESGTITYSYDLNGNLATKKAASPNQVSTGTATVIATYTYDALNRIAGKSYNDTYSNNPATPSAKYGYDGVALTGCVTAPPNLTDTYPIGNRTAMCDGSGATAWAHDPMDRILQKRQTIGTIRGDYENDAFNLDGSVASVTSLGYGVVYTYGGAGRPLTATHSTTKFVENATYAPPGELASMTLGSATGFAGIIVNNAYNVRLQPILLSAGVAGQNPVFSECFNFHLHTAITTPCSFSASSLGDNGSVYQIVNTRDTTRTQNFMYDSLNRIQQAYSNGTQWGETFSPTATAPGVVPTTSGFDAWGNLTQRSGVTGKTSHEPLSTSAGTNNQLSGFGYDPAGNMTSNGSASYVYDAEDRLIATAATSYIYDGDGQRVEKCTEGTVPGTCASSATGTLYWRGLGSAPLSETDLSGNVQNTYIFFNGQRVARKDSTGAFHYYFSDQVGSHGVVVNATGSTCEQDIDYYPYGGIENDYCGIVQQNYKFNGKERDAESGLDNFGARYNASSLGRFMTPDWAARPTTVPYAVFGDPQSLNLYGFVRNDPVSRADPDGHDPGSAVAEPEVAEETVGEVLEELAPEAIEAGEGGGATLGPVGAAVGVTAVVVVGVGAYEYNKHFSNPGAPPAPPTPKPPAAVPSPQMAEHKEARPSTTEDHEQGKTRKKRDARGGEKGDKKREDNGMFPRKRPRGYPKNGSWPPKPPKPPDPPPPPPKQNDGTSTT